MRVIARFPIQICILSDSQCRRIFARFYVIGEIRNVGQNRCDGKSSAYFLVASAAIIAAARKLPIFQLFGIWIVSVDLLAHE